MTEHVLTIDLGTSGPKVALFTFDGAFVDGDFSPVELNVLPDGGVEQSPSAWWRGAVAAARRVMERTTVSPDDVVAVAVTSQWSGTVPIDRDGTPLHDAIIWMDARGAAETRRVVGGALRVAGLRAAQAAHLDQPHGRRARALGQGLDLAHPLVAARTTRHRARRGSTSSRRTG